jgi:Ca-activated chloride channel homolog
LLVGAAALPAVMAAQDARPTFRTAVDRVTLSATVRTGRGRPVTDLKAHDFRLYDSGELRPISDIQTEPTPISLGLLVDFSGSMDVAARRQVARDDVADIVGQLAPGVDSAGLFVFDKELRVLRPPTPAPGDILTQFDSIRRPFGATSLFDAIAETGREMARQTGGRRAVVAFTDGADNSSRMTPAEVSGLASSIDVPVYVIVVISPFDRVGKTPMDEAGIARMLESPLANLARWTGGDIYASLGPQESSRTAQQIVAELRQQYLIAFEPDRRPGWHPIELRTARQSLIVRTRSGYIVRDEPVR